MDPIKTDSPQWAPEVDISSRRQRIPRKVKYSIVIWWLFAFVLCSRYLTAVDPSDNRNALRSNLYHLRKHASALVSKDALNQSIHHYFTAAPHLAGQNLALVNYTNSSLTESGFTASVERYDVLLNYPVDHRVSLLDGNGSTLVNLSLEEPALKEDLSTGDPQRIATFHGYSANGSASGELVYANYGRVEDFKHLAEHGVDVKGKIVLVRYGRVFRGLKVKLAEEYGAVGVLIYSEPADDGEFTEQNGFQHYPNGPARHPESVQRGSVQDLPFGPGDPTTPGYASVPGAPRESPHNIPSIPSIPISFADSLPLWKALAGHGPKISGWAGSLDGVDYSSGPSELPVYLENIQDYDIRPIHNVIGRIQGESNNEVIIGNHRDAWIIGGADPNSGSAVLLEVARILGELVKAGWTPKRSIKIASWDGEEYGLLGSTEHGEDHASSLQNNAIAYLNCDVAVSGSNFEVSANPLLKDVIDSAVKDIEFKNSTLWEHWGGDEDTRISPLGSGSDYTVFQDHLGIPSVDLGFNAGSEDPVYHYHSNYDSLYWMARYGDPTLDRHVAVTRALVLIALDLVEFEVLPFSLPFYAESLKRDIKSVLEGYKGPAEEAVSDLFTEAGNFLARAEDFERETWHIYRDLRDTDDKTGFRNGLKRAILKLKLRRANSKIRKLDQLFLYSEGLEKRPWFKHIVYAPGRYTGYAGQVLPGIAESLEDADEERLIKWVEITLQALKSAQRFL